MLYLVINTKNYLEASGPNALKLARTILKIQDQKKMRVGPRVSIYLSVPSFAVSIIASIRPKVKVLSQHLDDEKIGSTTGFQVAELSKSFGSMGSIINHSEHRLPYSLTRNLVLRLKELKMTSIVCAGDVSDLVKLAKLSPDFIAIEPPELIGSGRAVSKEKPEIITDSRKALDEVNEANGAKTKLLCGAGIVDMSDAKAAISLGAEGILVASGVVKAPDWSESIKCLIEGIKSGST